MATGKTGSSLGRLKRNKGAAGERELARFLTEHGLPAIRGRQYQGGNDSPDVKLSVEGYHFECKRTEVLHLWDALRQAQADAHGKTPIVAHRPNRKEWIAVLTLEKLVSIITELEELRAKGLDNG